MVGRKIQIAFMLHNWKLKTANCKLQPAAAPSPATASAATVN